MVIQVMQISALAHRKRGAKILTSTVEYSSYFSIRIEN
jgi:hypothetical protein